MSLHARFLATVTSYTAHGFDFPSSPPPPLGQRFSTRTNPASERANTMSGQVLVKYMPAETSCEYTHTL